MPFFVLLIYCMLETYSLLSMFFTAELIPAWRVFFQTIWLGVVIIATLTAFQDVDKP